MTIAVVNTAKAVIAGSAGNSQSTNTFSATTGNHITVFVRSVTTNTVSSVTDTAGNTYTVRSTGPNFDPSIWCYTAENITGHASNQVTVTISGVITFWWVYAVQCSGLATSSATDIASSAKTGTGVTDLVSNSFSTAQAEEIVLVAASQNALTNYTVGTDFTLLDGSIGLGGLNFGGVQYRITSSALSSYTAHITSGVTNQYNMAVLSLKGAGGAASRVVKFAGEWGGFAGTSGGFAG